MTFALHVLDTDSDRFVILHDGKPVVVGDVETLMALASRLDGFLLTGIHDGIFSHVQLHSSQILTVHDAVELSGMSSENIQRACRRGYIEGAEKRGKVWVFLRGAFVSWFEGEERGKRGPKR